MEFHYTLCFPLILVICTSTYIAGVDSKPRVTLLGGYVDTASIDREYIVPHQQPITDYHLSRLGRGYYYVEDGFITAIPESIIYGNRRVDTVTTNGGGGEGSRVANYKRTHGKRKKLFVPNLFG